MGEQNAIKLRNLTKSISSIIEYSGRKQKLKQSCQLIYSLIHSSACRHYLQTCMQIYGWFEISIKIQTAKQMKVVRHSNVYINWRVHHKCISSRGGLRLQIPAFTILFPKKNLVYHELQVVFMYFC